MWRGQGSGRHRPFVRRTFFCCCTRSSHLSLHGIDGLNGGEAGDSRTQACAKMFDDKVEIYASEERAPQVGTADRRPCRPIEEPRFARSCGA